MVLVTTRSGVNTALKVPQNDGGYLMQLNYPQRSQPPAETWSGCEQLAATLLRTEMRHLQALRRNRGRQGRCIRISKVMSEIKRDDCLPKCILCTWLLFLLLFDRRGIRPSSIAG
jgi:hypothetical protein